jgi:hypothetical protein
MPAGVTKFNGEAEIPWQLAEKSAQRQLAILWREGRRKLDQDNAQFCSQRFDGAEKRIYLGGAIVQPGRVCDLTGKFTRETEVSGGHLDPTPNAIFRRNSVKSRIHFNCCEIVGVEFQPMGLWQIRRIENATPVFKAPRARADAYLLLIG